MSEDKVREIVDCMIGTDTDVEHLVIFGTSRGSVVIGLGGFPGARLVSAAMEQRDGHLPFDLPEPTPKERDVVARFDEGLHRLGECGVGGIACYHLIGSPRYTVGWSSAVSEAEARDRLVNHVQCGIMW